MAISLSTSLSLLLFTLLLLTTHLPISTSEIRFTQIRSNPQPIIPIDEFGFTHNGHLDINITLLSLHNSNPSPTTTDLSLVGFFLTTRDSWYHVLDQLSLNDIVCPLQSDLVIPVITFTNHLQQSSLSLNISQPNLYTLLFANCVESLQVSVNVKSEMYNLEKGNDGKFVKDYLSAGKTMLPVIYFMLCMGYVGLVLIWVFVILSKRKVFYKIHAFMLVVLVLKCVNLLCEAEDKGFIKRTGTAHGWDVLFYVFSFLKGVTLFSLIVLIGTGWSFLKPFLQDKEKKVLMIVIPLQVVANVAQVVVDETGPYGQESYTWKQVFLLVDVVCCCAVLFPIVWSIKNLREAARSDGKAAVNLMKLTLFKNFYVVVICYIYFTRVVVYALETITSYRFQWTSVVASELGTLAFYLFTGYNFRPKPHNPYFAIDDEEEEAAVEMLKMDEDAFEL